MAGHDPSSEWVERLVGRSTAAIAGLGFLAGFVLGARHGLAGALSIAICSAGACAFFGASLLLTVAPPAVWSVKFVRKQRAVRRQQAAPEAGQLEWAAKDEAGAMSAVEPSSAVSRVE